MQKTGKFAVLFALFLFLFGAMWNSAYSQSSPKIEATVSKSKIFLGEQFSLSIQVSGSFSNLGSPNLPEFRGFRLLSNTPAIQEKFTMTNGRYSATYSYTYNLIPQEKGTQRIPPVKIRVDGEQYETDPIDVEVIGRGGTTTNRSSQPEIFLRLQVSDKTPVPGQQLLASIFLYFKEGLEVSSYQPVPGWKAEGFWKEELHSAGRPKANSTIVDGMRYNRARLLQFALFPTKTGELTISPYEIIVSVRSTSSRGGSFGNLFGNFGNNQRQVELKSDPVVLDVKSLPPLQGSDYIGAVGTFRISRNLNKKEVYVGESIEIETIVDGTGNVPLIGKPDYELPEGLEIYEPRESSSINRLNQQISGAKIFTDIVVARTPGTYSIPSREIIYFNPDRNRYILETLPEITFTAKHNPNAVTTGDRPLSLNVKPVTGLARWDTPSGTMDLKDQWWFWTGLIFPLIVFGLGWWQKTYHDKMQSDTAFARSKKANDKAAERLEAALRYSEEDNIKEAYNLLHKALTGYISDKLHLPEAGLSIEEYVSALEEHNIDPELAKNVRMLLEKCATISFAPETTHAYLKSHVGLAQSILEKLKKDL